VASSVEADLFDQILSNKIVVLSLSLMACMVAAWFWIRIKSISSRWHLAFFAMAASLIYTLPLRQFVFLLF
jgi:hypothetical protein